MDGRATTLIRSLGLRPHPEGGHYLEVFRSTQQVAGPDGPRSACTHILFLLAAGERSRWHRLAADELWHWYEGGPLELLTAGPTPLGAQTRQLGALSDGARPSLDVPAGFWQAARPLGAFTLAGCTVAPGFDFRDFLLLADAPAELAGLRARGIEPGDLL
jgi:predicted cupin superfamily sugar epimerase